MCHVKSAEAPALLRMSMSTFSTHLENTSTNLSKVGLRRAALVSGLNPRWRWTCVSCSVREESNNCKATSVTLTAQIFATDWPIAAR